MTDAELILIGSIVGAILKGIFDFAVARLSARSKQDKAAGLIQKYLSINEMTVDQLEESLNQVWTLTNEKISMQRKLSEIEASRTSRDEKFEAMESHIAALQTQINQDATERGELRKKLDEFEAKYRAMFQYLLALLEHMRKHGIKPPHPPKVLESDPEIMKFVRGAE